MSLKPPWKQENPIMEKACPAYHKNTAPAKAVEILDSIKFESIRDEKTFSSYTVVFNGKLRANDVTSAYFLEENENISIPRVNVNILTREGWNSVRVADLYGRGLIVYKNGKEIARLEPGIKHLDIKF